MTARPILFSGPMVRALLEGRKTQTRRAVKPQPPSGHVYVGRVLCSTHRADEGKWTWAVGQAAMLREAHRVSCPYGQPGDLLWVRETFGEFRENWIGYRATCGDPPPDSGSWKPSIFMPRWASRLTLRITDVRVQRLQDCSHADAAAEGVGDLIEYGVLWESINGPGSWDANPWVWALTFKVIKANVDDVAAAP